MVRKIDLDDVGGQHLLLVTLAELVEMEITTPSLQRPLDVTRVNEIVMWQRDREARHGSFLFVGGLTCARTRTPCLILLDGQHRYHAMKALAHVRRDHVVSVNVVECPGAGITIDELFKLINRAEPVPDYVIQTTLRGHRRMVLDTLRALIVETFPSFISKSRAPRRPNINVDTLLGQVEASEVLARLPDLSCDAHALFGYLLFANACQGATRNAHALAAEAKTAKSGSTQQTLYLSSDADSNWTRDERLVLAFSWKSTETPHPPSSSLATSPSLNVPTAPSRVSIPKAVRHAVWNASFGREAGLGQCYCCSGVVSQQDFECGHVMSVACGGGNDLENLKPVCGACNKSIGPSNMDDFKAAFGFGREAKIDK